MGRGKNVHGVIPCSGAGGVLVCLPLRVRPRVCPVLVLRFWRGPLAGVGVGVGRAVLKLPCTKFSCPAT